MYRSVRTGRVVKLACRCAKQITLAVQCWQGVLVLVVPLHCLLNKTSADEVATCGTLLLEDGCCILWCCVLQYEHVVNKG